MAEKKEEKKFDDSKALIADGKKLLDDVVAGGRFQFLAAKLKKKHGKDLAKELLK